MKIKVIDLLIKNANKELIDVKAKYDNAMSEWDEEDFLYSVYIEIGMRNTDEIIEFLNDEVEIIENYKKIEHCIGFQHFESVEDYIDYLRIKTDELIDEINKLKEK